MKKILVFLYAAIAVHAAVFADTTVPPGDVSGTWTKSGSPYLIQGDITLLPGDTLVIEPGVVVEFQGYYEFLIQGDIQAAGMTNDTILFTVNDSSAFYSDLNNSAGSWSGIYFSGSDNSKFYCCKFKYAKALGASVSTYWGGAMYIPASYTNLMIRACHFDHNYAQNNGGAITVNSTGVFTIDSCLFTNNTAGSMGGAVFAQDGAFYLRDNEFHDNTANEGGAVGFWGDSKMKMYGNQIHHNTAQSGGGIRSYASTFTAVNNIIANNYANTNYGGALYATNTSFPKMTGNLIVNNTAVSHGGGLYLSNTNAVMTNNTIAYNQSVSGSGGGCYLTGSSPEIQNCIVYANTPSQVHIGTSLSIPNIYYSDLQGGIAAFTGSAFNGIADNNIDADPEFESSPGGAGYLSDGVGANWALQTTSPCINAGSPDLAELHLPDQDVYDNQRVSNSIIDQGAAETHIDVITAGGSISSDEYWLADTVKVTGDVTVQDDVTLTINPGTVVQFQDFYQLTVTGTLIARGTPGDTILFTVPESQRPTGWNGIYINNSGGNMFDNDSSVIDVCRLEYAKSVSGDGGALEVRYFSKLRVSNSVFMYDSAAYRGAGIYVEYCSPVIASNLFSHNHADRGAVASSYGSPLIEGNTIIYNTSSEYVGGFFGWWSNCVIRDNFIANNDKGIKVFASNTKSYLMVNNVIANNERSGVEFSGQDLIMVNNTIVNNNGSGISFSDARLTILNCVFSGNDYNSISVSEEPVQVYNCLVEGGLDQLVNPSMPNLEQDNNIDSLPEFINPTEGAGWSYGSVPEDWELYSISPCINAGRNSFSGLTLPSKDILGNPRINMNTIDIGAIENQGADPVILSQPIGGIRCTGDTIVFSIEVNDTVYYQWQKEGSDIPGANSAFLALDSVIQTHEGNYRCMIRNAYGTYTTGTVLLIVKQAPDLLLAPESQWVRKGSHQTLTVLATGTRPIGYQWYLDGTAIPGEDESELDFPSIDYGNEGTYHCEISNVCGTVETDSAVYFVAPEICMVTVDSVTGKNLIIWEKQTSAELLSYNVYREGIVAGFYDLIGAVPNEDLSVFVDSTADPTSQAYWYKITATDTSGRETGLDLCIPHKTIHLLTTINPETGATQLAWDPYIGFSYGTYYILRSSTENNFSVFHSMASSTSTWSDITGGEEQYYYRVAVQKTGDCTPTGNTKASAGPYSHSLSNLDDNKLQSGTGVPGITGGQVRVFPNPFTLSTMLQFPNPEGKTYTLYIMDLSGKIQRIEHDITGFSHVIERGNLGQGYYLFELRGDVVYKGRLVIH